MSSIQESVHDSTHTVDQTTRAGRLKQLALLVTGLVLLGSLACLPPRFEGISDLGIQEGGQLTAREEVRAYFDYGYPSDTENEREFESKDGGITWSDLLQAELVDRQTVWGDKEVDTPRGTYYLRPDGIGLRTSDSHSLVYSTDYLRTTSNRTQQRLATRQFNPLNLSLEPQYIVYHEKTGHIIASMGLQGVLVQDSSETWHRIAVGPYSPTNFSFGAKLTKAFTERGFWPTAATASIAFSSIALVFTRRLKSCCDWAVALFSSSVLMLATLWAVATLYSTENFSTDGFGNSFLSATGIITLFLAIMIGLSHSVAFWTYYNPKRAFLFVVGGVLLFMVALFALAFLIDVSTPFYSTTNGKIYAFLFMSVAAISLYVYVKRSLPGPSAPGPKLSSTKFWGKSIKPA